MNVVLWKDPLPGLNNFFNGDFFSTDAFIPHLSQDLCTLRCRDSLHYRRSMSSTLLAVL